MVAGGEMADEPTPLRGAQRRVRRFADQRIPEQRDVSMTVLHLGLHGLDGQEP